MGRFYLATVVTGLSEPGADSGTYGNPLKKNGDENRPSGGIPTKNCLLWLSCYTA